jgi:hypothetical protein
MVPVRIENRSQLVYLLTEAAELEHAILCCYLFASFSLKQSTEEGLTEAQVAQIDEWRRLLNGIAVQEMIHFATACNLLTAIGGSPQLRRPNLPSHARAYPPRFQLRLMRFGLEALEQFVSLEQPESVWEAQTLGEYRATAVPLDRLSDIFSSERNYATVGELYRGIQDGFAYLTQKLGERELFVGPPSGQTADTFFSLPGLIPVHDLASALEAINVIVEQGEGASEDAEDSHYKRFLRLRDEYVEAVTQEPGFDPARPVVINPHAMLPADLGENAEVSLIDDPVSVDVGNLFDGSYELMIQVLGRLFVHAEESPEDLAVLADISVSLMFDVVQPLGQALSSLPAGPSFPGMNAGAGFRLSRGAGVPSHRDAARAVFRERLNELEQYCRFLQIEPGAPKVLGDVRDALSRYAGMLQ